MNLEDLDFDLENDTGTHLHSSPTGSAFVVAEARNFALNLVGNTTTTKILLNDLHNNNVESNSSLETVEPVALSNLVTIPKNACGVPSRLVQEKISNFHLALGLWCEKEHLTQRAYNRLSEVLQLVTSVANLHSLLHTLRTLQQRCRRQLPLPLLHKTIVPVKHAKQPSGLRNSIHSGMYFFDMRILLATVLSTTKKHVFHTGMADIVDNPTEYWHSRLWGFSIRTCSQDYVVYSNLTPVITLDFVAYFCGSVDCAVRHDCYLGQIVFFGQNQRSNSMLKGKVLLQICRVQKATCSLHPHEILASQIPWTQDKIVLIEKDDCFIQLQQLQYQQTDVHLQRELSTLHNQVLEQHTQLIQYVFNATSRRI